jgi:hypothetical protein
MGRKRIISTLKLQDSDGFARSLRWDLIGKMYQRFVRIQANTDLKKLNLYLHRKLATYISGALPAWDRQRVHWAWPASAFLSVYNDAE